MNILTFERKNRDLKIIGKLINELDNVDECSMAFRYSFQSDNEGKIRNHILGRKCIDIELKTYQFMEGINDLSYVKCQGK